MTRKQQLTQRADRYRDTRENLTDCAMGWEAGYRAALKDVRRALGKSGTTRRVRALLQPMR